MNGKKVLVIGIDGATFEIINTLIEGRRLPTIARLMRNGVHGILNSTIPALSPVAWTSFMTGKKPDKHQIYDFPGKIDGTYSFRMNSAINRKAEPFWMDLSKIHKRVCVLGVTLTYPPDPVNGYMVSGLGAPHESDAASYTYPPEFAKELIDAVGKYYTVPEADLRRLSISDKEKDKFIAGVFNQIDYRVNLFTYLWNKERFDFSMIFFLDTDGISHYFWKYMDTTHRHHERNAYSDAIYKVYEKIDHAVEALMAMVGDEVDVIIVSDHGFGPLNRVVFLNNWLQSKGYLKFKNMSPLRKAVTRLTDMARRHTGNGGREIEWRETKAYFSGTTGNIFINLKGRDPEGIVDASECDSLCETLKTELLKLEDRLTGNKVVEQVYRRADLYDDVNVSIAPDLVVAFKKGYSVVGEEISLHDLRDTGEIVADSNNWSGTHEPEGVFIACGKSFKQGHTIHNAHIIDLAPTIAYLLGSPVRKSFDGKVLEDAIEDSVLQSRPVLYTEDTATEPAPEMYEAYDESEEEEIRKRLRDLGYID